MHCGIVDLLRRPRRFKHVTLEELVINIPPGGLKKQRQSDRARLGKAATRRSDAVTEPPPAAGERRESPIIVDELLADGALLRIIPRREGKQPKEFAIHALTMRSLGHWRADAVHGDADQPAAEGTDRDDRHVRSVAERRSRRHPARRDVQLSERRSRHHQGHRRDPRFDGRVRRRARADRRQGRDTRSGLSPRHQPAAGGARARASRRSSTAPTATRI